GAQSNSTAATATSAPTSPPTSAPATAPADYAQRLFGQVQAWRENLEQAVVRPVAPQQQAANGDPGTHPGTKQSATVPPPEMEVVAPMTVDGTQGPQSLYGPAYLGGPEKESTGGQSLYALGADHASRRIAAPKPRSTNESTRVDKVDGPVSEFETRREILPPREDLHVQYPWRDLNQELK
ncbi:MAG: hypothetical protein JHC55_20680, partial [Mycolicibacterium sp.]|nr:hypothetical protein [Mycolicibacterium sp.]